MIEEVNLWNLHCQASPPWYFFVLKFFKFIFSRLFSVANSQSNAATQVPYQNLGNPYQPTTV